MITFDVPLFGGRVTVHDNQDQWQQHRASITGNAPRRPSAGVTATLTHPNGRREYIVGVFDGSQGTLVHELTHVALEVLGDRGIDPATGDGEVMAALMDRLFILATAPTLTAQ